MLRFDSEEDLESHELGRSLLFMVRDEDGDLDGLPSLHRIERPSNPFEVVRERLAEVTLAIEELQPQVHLDSVYIASCSLAGKNDLPYTYTVTRPTSCILPFNYSEIFVHVSQQNRSPFSVFHVNA